MCSRRAANINNASVSRCIGSDNSKARSFSPKGVPPATLQRFRKAFVDALSLPEVTEKLRASDQVVVGNTPEEAAQVLAADSRKWGEVARRIKLGLD